MNSRSDPRPLRIAVAADLAGHEYKHMLLPLLRGHPHVAAVVDVLPRETVTYPEAAVAAANLVKDGAVDRQQQVRAGALTDFRALVDERALRVVANDPTVSKLQMERALEESEDPRNTIRILPDTIGLHPGSAGPFVLMVFPEAARQVVWVETMVSSLYFDGGDDVQRYSAPDRCADAVQEADPARRI